MPLPAVRFVACTKTADRCYATRPLATCLDSKYRVREPKTRSPPDVSWTRRAPGARAEDAVLRQRKPHGGYPKQSKSAGSVAPRPLACGQRRGQPDRMRCRDGAPREARSLRSCAAIAACRLHAPPELRMHLSPLPGSSRSAAPCDRAWDGRAGRAAGAAPRTGTARGRPIAVGAIYMPHFAERQ